MDVIIDTDPGIDDALALLIALGSPGVRVKSIVATYGNIKLNQAVRNILSILEIACPVPSGLPSVFRGSESPLLRPRPKKDPRIHGKNGLGNAILPAPHLKPGRGTGLQAALRSSGKKTLICLGPLTDLARLILSQSGSVRKIERIILMGGVLTVPGNVTPFAEFNVFCDPEAAKIVFNSGLPITMVGLDVTHRTLLTEQDLKFLDTSSPRLNFIDKICRYYINFHKKYRGMKGCYLHDLLAVAVAIDRSIVKTERMAIDVEVENAEKLGRTFIRKGGRPNIDVCLKVDIQKFRKIGIASIGLLP